MIYRAEHIYSQAFKSFFFSKQDINTFNLISRISREPEWPARRRR